MPNVTILPFVCLGRLNPGNAMRRYFDAWVPTEVRVRVWVGDSILDRRFEIAVPRKSGTRPVRAPLKN